MADASIITINPHTSECDADELELKRKEFEKKFEQRKEIRKNQREQLSTEQNDKVVQFWKEFKENIESVKTIDDLKEVQEFYNRNMRNLNQYDCRKVQIKLDETRKKLQPKKLKFSFRNRSKLKQQSEIQPKIEEKVERDKIEAKLVFGDKSNQNLSLKTNKDEDFLLHKCTNCNISIPTISGAAYITDLSNCNVKIAPIIGSVFISNCSNCNFKLTAKQIRIHATNNCNMMLFTASNPIIEHSKGIKFSKRKMLVGQEILEQIPYLKGKNFYANVKDFNWLKSQTSPNWSLAPSNS